MAAPGDVGFRSHSYAPLTDPPTGSKPESKLWFNGGWWAIMLDPATHAQHIFRLDRTAQAWQDTGVAVDTRQTAHADVLWDASSNKLYVASHDFTEYPARPTANGARLWRFSYDAGAGTYRPDPGFPVTINDAKTETLVIAKDSKGKLWATWVADLKVWVAHTTSSDSTWGTPYTLPGTGANVTIDDISSVVAFGGKRIGVLWSNQGEGQFRFASHTDGAGDRAGNWTVVTLPPGAAPDDHLNLKADSAGRVYAVVKHAAATGPATAPFISLFVRDTGGTWNRTTVGSVGDSNTRPIVLLDEQRQELHVVNTGPTPPSTNGQRGGTIYDRTSPLGAISFAPGQGLPLIRPAAGGALNDVTSTKQNLDASTGLVVLASETSTFSYWHADLGAVVPPPPPPQPPPPPPPVKPRRVALNARVARVQTARTLARLYGRSWKRGRAKYLRCVRRTGRPRSRTARPAAVRYRTYDCRVSWRTRSRRYRGRSTVVRQGSRITTRIRVQTIRP